MNQVKREHYSNLNNILKRANVFFPPHCLPLCLPRDFITMNRPGKYLGRGPHAAFINLPFSQFFDSDSLKLNCLVGSVQAC